ncbi:MAG: hypothetical protein AAGC74_07110 [Verrucomicrobiota bacterium]
MTITLLQPHQAKRFRTIRLRSLRDSPDAFGSTYRDTLARHPEIILRADIISFTDKGAWASRPHPSKAGKKHPKAIPRHRHLRIPRLPPHRHQRHPPSPSRTPHRAPAQPQSYLKQLHLPPLFPLLRKLHPHPDNLTSHTSPGKAAIKN